ncbi:MAG TPA: hypothetical protein VFY00_08885 [Arenimonas sp.]|nr:hypothetical protein [Arenimonas sp.]
MAVAYSESSSTTVPAVKRVSWGAIFVGVVIAMVVQLLLAVLGIAIGASTINPLQEASPIEGIGMGAGIYWVASSIIALFAGGYAAGALTNTQDRRDRTLHGVSVWGVATLLVFLAIGSGVGRLIGGTASVVGSGLSMAGNAVSSVAPQAMDAAQRRLNESDFDLELDLDLGDWRAEVRELLRDSGVSALQPSQLEEEADELQQQLRAAAQSAGQDPMAADQELESLLDQIQREARETLRAVDREALVNIVMERTGQSRQEASQTVANWEQGYQQAYQAAREEWQEAKMMAERKAREWGDQAADAVAAAAWWTFIMLLLGAIASAVGANAGAGRAVVVREERLAR